MTVENVTIPCLPGNVELHLSLLELDFCVDMDEGKRKTCLRGIM
jgi:hypothetical protein